VITLIFFLFIGGLLLLALLFMARRSSKAEGDAQVLLQARQALDALQSGLLPRELVHRIFAREDSDYVATQRSKAVEELFIGERRKIGLAWVNQVYAQVSALKRFHRSAARFYTKLSPRTELEIACHFAALTVACRALQALLYVGGPFVAPRVVAVTATAASRICTISEQSLAFLNPVQLSPAAGHSASTEG